MSSLPTLEQIYTFDFLFMLLGCNAGLECFCGQIKQDSPCSVVPCSWQDPQPHMPSRCIGSRRSWWKRKRAPDSPELAADTDWVPLAEDLLTQVCPLGSPLMQSLLLKWCCCCCCPETLSSAYPYPAQFSNLIHNFKSLTSFRKLRQLGEISCFSQGVIPPLQLPSTVLSRANRLPQHH